MQELEARLLHMESLFAQIAPALEQQMAVSSNGAAQGGIPDPKNPESLAPAAAILRSIAPKVAPSPEATATTPPPDTNTDDDVSELFGQLALDEYGHMRWIGGSSTMSLIQSFRALTSSPLHRISPMEEDPQAPGPSVNKLYFPAAVFFGKIHALPGPEEVEFPVRDLADKLVSAIPSSFDSYAYLCLLGRGLLCAPSLPDACHRQALFFQTIRPCHGQPTRFGYSSLRNCLPLAYVRRICMCCQFGRRPPIGNFRTP